jgi:uncharacterized protein (TIGR02001 family)
LRRAFACALFAGAVGAQAQVSGSATLVSDYRFRGISLSDERPAAQIAVSYDHESGAYAGAFASNVRLFAEEGSGVQALGYVGYATRGAGGLSWDIGAAYSHFSRPSGYSYAEYHVGTAGTDWSARLSYAPRYFGQTTSAIYAEVNLTPGSESALVPLLHFGFLHTESPPYYAERSRWDGRIGLAYSLELFTFQLSWGIASDAGGSADGGQHRSAWVLRVTRWL